MEYTCCISLATPSTQCSYTPRTKPPRRNCAAPSTTSRVTTTPSTPTLGRRRDPSAFDSRNIVSLINRLGYETTVMPPVTVSPWIIWESQTENRTGWNARWRRPSTSSREPLPWTETRATSCHPSRSFHDHHHLSRITHPDHCVIKICWRQIETAQSFHPQFQSEQNSTTF